MRGTKNKDRPAKKKEGNEIKEKVKKRRERKNPIANRKKMEGDGGDEESAKK